MKNVFGALMLSLAATSCGPMESPLRGTWFGGPIAMTNNANQSDSIFANWNLTIASTGVVTGTAMTLSPTRTIETGTITGSSSVMGTTGTLDFTSITFPTLGTFAVSGSFTYAGATNQLGFSGLTVRNAAGTPIGTATGVITRQ